MRSIRALAALVAAILAVAAQCAAQEQLANPSFETPVAPNSGNNFYASITGWTIVAQGNPAQPVNLVKPNASYTGGPTAPPNGGGLQYLDVNSTSGVLSQTITFAGPGTVDWGGWFSVRDNVQNIGGCTVDVKNSAGTVIATQTVSFTTSDSLQTWRRAGGTNLTVAAGTYTFEAIVPDPINFDLATFYFYPALTVAKSGTTVQDPIDGTTNPKAIPGSFRTYALKVVAPGPTSVTASSQNLADATPAGLALVVSGTYAPTFAAGSSGLTMTYSGPTSTTDAVDFSSDGGGTWTYAPTPDSRGVDPAVTNVRFRPQGTMASSSTYTVSLTYAVK